MLGTPKVPGTRFFNHPIYPRRSVPTRSCHYIPGISITAFCINRAGPTQNILYCVLSTRKTTLPCPIGWTAAKALTLRTIFQVRPDLQLT